MESRDDRYIYYKIKYESYYMTNDYLIQKNPYLQEYNIWYN